MPDNGNSPEVVYENPLAYELCGQLIHLPNFPSEAAIIGFYTVIKSLPADDIVDVVVSQPSFVSYIDFVRSAIRGMNWRGVGRVLNRFLDRNYPLLMKEINSNDESIELYKNVIIKLVDKVQSDNSSLDVDHNVSR
jgi:hypothetical protein